MQQKQVYNYKIQIREIKNWEFGALAIPRRVKEREQ